MTQPTLMNFHSYAYSQELRYYSSTVNLHTCVRNYNTLNKLSNKVCVPNKTEDFSLSIFNFITRINGFKTLAKHISCLCQCKFNDRKNYLNQTGITINIDVNVKIWTNIMCTKKIMFRILLHVIAKMVNT